jgi:hypothetical protein
VQRISVAGPAARMATLESLVAGPSTSSIRSELQEVIRPRDRHGILRMAWALQLQASAKVVLSFQLLDDICPHRYMTVRIGVADDVHAVLGAR